MVGEPIPWRKMGYQTLEEFLDQSPDLCRVAYTAQGVMVHGVATEKSAHVAEMVSQQRNTKKRSKPVKPPSRRPFTRQWQPPQSSQQFRGGPYNRNHQGGGGGGGNRPSRPGGSGRFPTLQNRSPQALAQYQQQQQQQRLRTPNYPAVNGMSRGGAGRTQAKPQASTNQVCAHMFQRVVYLPVYPTPFACTHVSKFPNFLFLPCYSFNPPHKSQEGVKFI